MSSVNRAIIIGNLGADPEIRSFQNGGQVCNLRVATSESWKDRNTGERRERAEWHSVAITAEHLVRFAENYLRKGSKVYIEGQLQTRKWQDQSGNDRYTTEIVLRPYKGELVSLDKREDSQPSQGYDPSRPATGSANGGGYGGAPGGMDDEIPFAPEWR